MKDLLVPLDWFVIAGYLVAVLVVGIWSGRKIATLEEYAVAGRSYPWYIIFATSAATFVGGGFTMGNAEKVFKLGIACIVALWAFSLQEILLAKFLAPKLKLFPKAISVGDVMEVNFGKLGKIASGVFSVTVCAGILGAQVGGTGSVFEYCLGWDKLTGIVVGVGILIAYDTFGGMRAVVATDVMQFIILAIVFVVTLVLGLVEVGGPAELVDKVPPEHLQLFGTMTPLALLTLFLSFLIGETLVPPYAVRLFVGQSRAVGLGKMAGGIFSIPFFVMVGVLGLIALALDPTLDPIYSTQYVMARVLPAGLRGLAIAGLMAVLMSSADSFLNSASTAFVNDIVAPLLPKPLTSRSALKVARVSTLFTGVIAIVFAVRIDGLLDILLYSYNFWAPVVVVPLIYTMLGRRATTTAFVAAGIAGLGSVLIWDELLSRPLDLEGLVIGTAVNALVFFSVNTARGQWEPAAAEPAPQEAATGPEVESALH